MNLAELRSQLEDDLSWRLDEIRHLRNTLLGQTARSSWPASALRAILVMQYAHLEGFAQNAFSLYVEAINSRQLKASDAQPHLFVSALIPEFNALRHGSGNEPESEDSRLTRRVTNQLKFVQKLRLLGDGPLIIDAEAAVSMEMNFGADVLRRMLFMLGIPETKVGNSYYTSLEFVRRQRNVIAHGGKWERIEPGLFEVHQGKCEQFMNDLARLLTLAVTNEWFRATATGAH